MNVMDSRIFFKKGIFKNPGVILAQIQIMRQVLAKNCLRSCLKAAVGAHLFCFLHNL